LNLFYFIIVNLMLELLIIWTKFFIIKVVPIYKHLKVNLVFLNFFDFI